MCPNFEILNPVFYGHSIISGKSKPASRDSPLHPATVAAKFTLIGLLVLCQSEFGLINKICVRFEINLPILKSGYRSQFCRFLQSERSILTVSNTRTSLLNKMTWSPRKIN